MRRFNAQEKWGILLEALGSPVGPEVVCQKHGIDLPELKTWLSLARDGALSRLGGASVPPPSAPLAAPAPPPVSAVTSPPTSAPGSASGAPQKPLAEAQVDALFSMVSHELKEPTRGIRALCQFLEEDYKDQLPDRANSYLKMMADCAQRMNCLIEGLSEYARIGRRHEAPRRVVLTDLLLQVRAGLQSMLEARHASVVLDSRLPDVMGDPILLSQAFRHLLENGVRFNTSPQPRVEVVWGGGDLSGSPSGMVSILVRDNGIGIAEKHFERIFELYARLHRYETYPGAGVGLAVARRVVRLHGGELTVSSTEGEGSTFCMTLPGVE